MVYLDNELDERVKIAGSRAPDWRHEWQRRHMWSSRVDYAIDRWMWEGCKSNAVVTILLIAPDTPIQE
jgi:hypothetical protein